jgi:NAD dependent epimerase/dehydratase family enzyme
MADILINGQRTVPEAALKLGYNFKYPHRADALRSLKL